MCRMHCLMVAATGLFFIGCADTSTPTASNPPGQGTTVTANKSPSGEPLPEGALAPDGERSAELPAPDESLLPPSDAAEESADARAMRELKEAGDAVANWGAQSKDELITMAEERLADLDAEIDKLKSHSEGLAGDAKARWEEERQTLDERRAAFNEQLEELKTSGDAAWHEIAKGLMNAWSELQQASSEAAAKFK